MLVRTFLGWIVIAIAAFGADIWTGSSGGFTVRWSASDITAAPRDRPNEVVLSLRKEAAKNWAEITKDSYGQHLESSVTIRILSLVGPVLSIEQADGCDCGGAHPSATTRFRAIDLTRSRPDKAAPFLLLDAVAEPDLLAALKADKLVKHALASSAARPPASLPALIKAIAFQPIEVGNEDCSYAFGEDALSSFAFFDAAPKDAAVRLSLSHAAEVCRGQMTQAGIRVPVMDRVRPALDLARQHKEGFLMIDRTKIAPRAAATEFEFTK
jgi:hypothetical protein